MSEYRVLPGPEHFLPPAAASMDIQLPNQDEAHINGVIAPEEKAYEEYAMLSFRDASVEKIMNLADTIKRLKGTVQPRLETAKNGASS